MAVQQYAFFTVDDRDKTPKLVEFARGLHSPYMSIASSGGTARYLRNAGIEVTTVAELVARSTAHRIRSSDLLVHVVGDVRALLGDHIQDPSLIPRLLNSTFKDNLVERICEALGGGDILDHRVVTFQPEVMGPMLAT